MNELVSKQDNPKVFIFSSLPLKFSSSRYQEQNMQRMNKYMKHFFLKFAQMVVQSRDGDRISVDALWQPSWFEIGIKVIDEIQIEALKTLKTNLDNEQNILTRPLVIEISLTTNEGQPLTLEHWVLSMKKLDENTKSFPILEDIYRNMGLLLKSALCLSRLLPAHRVSRYQGDTYVVCYRFYSGLPPSNPLGHKCKTCQVGSLATPLGILDISVNYRPLSEMTLDPSQSNQNSSASSGGFTTPDQSNTSTYSEPGETMSQRFSEMRLSCESRRDTRRNLIARKRNYLKGDSSEHVFGAFTSEKVRVDVATATRLNVNREEHNEDEKESDGAKDEKKLPPENPISASTPDLRNTSSPKRPPESSECLDIRLPFASQSDAAGLRNRYLADSLGSFFSETMALSQSIIASSTSGNSKQSEDQGEIPEELENVTEQLARFERNAGTYDDMVQSLWEESGRRSRNE